MADGTKVFVGRVSPDWQDADFNAMAVRFGVPIEVILLKDGHGASKCSGFIRYGSDQEAMTAIAGISQEGMHASIAGQKEQRSDLGGVKVFIGRIPFACTDVELQAMAQTFGTVIECVLLRKQGKSAGCGFVRYATPEEADYAIKAITMDNSSPITASMAPNQGANKRPAATEATATDPNRIFVGQWPTSKSKEEAMAFFQYFGEVEDLYIPKSTQGNSAILFVSYRDSAGATAAIETLNGSTTMEGMANPLQVRYADAKKQRLDPAGMQGPPDMGMGKGKGKGGFDPMGMMNMMMGMPQMQQMQQQQQQQQPWDQWQEPKPMGQMHMPPQQMGFQPPQQQMGMPPQQPQRAKIAPQPVVKPAAVQPVLAAAAAPAAGGAPPPPPPGPRFANGWTEHIDTNGRAYFAGPTGAVQWEMPAEFKAAFYVAGA